MGVPLGAQKPLSVKSPPLTEGFQKAISKPIVPKHEEKESVAAWAPLGLPGIHWAAWDPLVYGPGVVCKNQRDIATHHHDIDHKSKHNERLGILGYTCGRGPCRSLRRWSQNRGHSGIPPYLSN